MDWDKLRIFHAAAEAGSFTHAGEALRMSQSASGGGIGNALQPIVAALAADGYQLSATFEGGSLKVGIVAGPDACEDCLVPKSMMTVMIKMARPKLPTWR